MALSMLRFYKSESPIHSKYSPTWSVMLVLVTCFVVIWNKQTGEISPLMPKSCRYVPTCSEYSMIAYKKYGVAKGSILTAWRLCRCNPLGIYLFVLYLFLDDLSNAYFFLSLLYFFFLKKLGGSGFDPPRWFDEPSPPEQWNTLCGGKIKERPLFIKVNLQRIVMSWWTIAKCG